MSELKRGVVAVVLYELEVAWLILVIRQRNDLGKLNLFGCLLAVMDLMAVNDDVLTEILISIQTVIVWRRWLIHRPVVEWWVDYWILLINLNQVISVNSINYQISKLQVLMSSITSGMGRRWLVD